MFGGLSFLYTAVFIVEDVDRCKQRAQGKFAWFFFFITRDFSINNLIFRFRLSLISQHLIFQSVLYIFKLILTNFSLIVLFCFFSIPFCLTFIYSFCTLCHSIVQFSINSQHFCSSLTCNLNFFVSSFLCNSKLYNLLFSYRIFVRILWILLLFPVCSRARLQCFEHMHWVGGERQWSVHTETGFEYKFISVQCPGRIGHSPIDADWLKRIALITHTDSSTLFVVSRQLTNSSSSTLTLLLWHDAFGNQAIKNNYTLCFCLSHFLLHHLCRHYSPSPFYISILA